MLALIVSTIVFFVARYYIMRWADDNEFPKGMTRSVSIFVLALASAYAVAALINKVMAVAGG